MVLLILTGSMWAILPSAVQSVEMCESVYYQVDGYWQRWTQCSPYRPNSTRCYIPTVSNYATGKPVIVSATVCYPTS